MTTNENLKVPVASHGRQVALLAETTIDTDGTVNNTAVTALDLYTIANVLLTVSAKTMDPATTLNIYVQYSPDGGTTWDDLISFTQVTNAAVGNGSYVVWLQATAASAVDRVITDGTLAANSLRGIHWGDRMRVKTVAANFAGSDEITIQLDAFMR